jgi:pimeloyl-ACP methyl ester carboxylesterase
VSARWLISAVALAILGAAFCAWATLCLLFWQGSWQLLYHPKSAVLRTPATAGLAFDSVGFAVNSAGQPQLHGWWIPCGPDSCYTVVYLHGSSGNLGDTVDAFIPFRAAGLNIFAFDYRGYGMSRFEHPSEARMREDAESALAYLTGTRHLPANTLVIAGRDLGANLALEVAAAHPELAGVILENPLEAPTAAIFNDPRARLVPTHLLVRDKWDPNTPAANLLIPSLWFYWTTAAHTQQDEPQAYRTVTARKSLVWLTGSSDPRKQYFLALSRWLDDLPKPKTH